MVIIILKFFETALKQEKYSSFSKFAFFKKLLDTRESQKNYLQDENILEENVHGHPPVKTKIRRLLAQWISGGQSGIY